MEPEILELESFLPYRLYRLADARIAPVQRQEHAASVSADR